MISGLLDVWVEVDGCGAMPKSLLTSMETLTVTAVNTMTPVKFVPVIGMFLLNLNGDIYTPDDGSFSVSGQQVVWVSTILSVQPGDSVTAIYNYMG